MAEMLETSRWEAGSLLGDTCSTTWEGTDSSQDDLKGSVRSTVCALDPTGHHQPDKESLTRQTSHIQGYLKLTPSKKLQTATLQRQPGRTVGEGSCLAEGGLAEGALAGTILQEIIRWPPLYIYKHSACLKASPSIH